jgi:hypothetical protein
VTILCTIQYIVCWVLKGLPNGDTGGTRFPLKLFLCWVLLYCMYMCNHNRSRIRYSLKQWGHLTPSMFRIQIIYRCDLYLYENKHTVLRSGYNYPFIMTLLDLFHSYIYTINEFVYKSSFFFLKSTQELCLSTQELVLSTQ